MGRERPAVARRHLALLAVVVAVVAPAGAAAAAVAKTPSVYWGANIGPHLTGTPAPWDLSAIDAFEAHTRKKASLLAFGRPWQSCDQACQFEAFPTDLMDSIRARGEIPVLDWGSYSYPSTDTQSQPDFQLADIAGGAYDDFIRSFAQAAQAWGHPFFLRFDWEMNLTAWFPWVERVNGNSPGQYVQMWQHVHDIFASVGATNVNWVWCPNQVSIENTPLPELYPGSGYVDWTCMDGYNWGTNPSHPWGWDTFDQVFRATYQQLRALAPGKPILIGETGSTEVGGSKSRWTLDALGTLAARFPAVKALVWFDVFDDRMDWPIESSASAQAAFAKAIGSPTFASNVFGDLAGPKIKPLTRLTPVAPRKLAPVKH